MGHRCGVICGVGGGGIWLCHTWWGLRVRWGIVVGLIVELVEVGFGYVVHGV